ncbi:MAG: DUF1080 domain-containing protein [Planctomycetota bacterium]
MPLLRNPRFVWTLAGIILSGCSSRTPSAPESGANPEQPSDLSTAKSPTEPKEEVFRFEAQAYETTPEEFLASRLPPSEAREGWIRVFDQHTLYGWTIEGEANWRVEGQQIQADRGQVSFLHTSTRWSDFELELQFQSDAETNSGVFIRSVLQPTDVIRDCFEINIAPPSNPFPTGSVVKRKKATALPADFDAEAWHDMRIVCNGPVITVSVDGDVVCQLEDAATPRSGTIALQHRSGPIAMRDIRLRPLGLESLLDEQLDQWKRYPEMSGSFEIDQQGVLVVDGGKQQLESKQSFGDFVMLAEYQLPEPTSNSGIFFRAIPGDEMMGYECQVNDEMANANPLTPADCGAGGIFRRQDARILASNAGKWNSIVLSVDGDHFATWVNGLQVVDVIDTRDDDDNPRRGRRLQPGTLMIQGHDPSTLAKYRQLSVAVAP